MRNENWHFIEDAEHTAFRGLFFSGKHQEHVYKNGDTLVVIPDEVAMQVDNVLSLIGMLMIRRFYFEANLICEAIRKLNAT